MVPDPLSSATDCLSDLLPAPPGSVSPLAGDTCRLRSIMCLLWTRASKSDPLPLQFWNKPYPLINLGDCWCLTLSWPRRGGQHAQLGIFQSYKLQLLQSGEGRSSLQAEVSWQKLGLGCLRPNIYFPLRDIPLNWFSPGCTESKERHPEELQGSSRSHLL